MPDHNSTKQTNPLHLLELLGKPIFFLFTILGVFFISYLHLIKVFVHQLLNIPKRLRTVLNRNSWLQAKKGSPAGERTVLVGKSRPKRSDLIGFPLHFPKITLPRFSRPNFRLTQPLFTLLSFVIIIIGLTFYQLILRDLPDPHTLSTSLPALSTKIYDRNHILLYQIYRDENRTLINLEDLPNHLVNATIAAEDKSFYHHLGISPTAIIRAFYSNTTCSLRIQSCTSLQGGSTITQQLVKNALLTPERTLTRKLKEAILALWIETIYTKDEILELYFNYVPYGGTAYGIEEGARYYFDKSSSDLNLAESTLLAGLPIAPTTLSPFGVNPYLAKHRQDQVLDRMRGEGYISIEEVNMAKETPLTFRSKGNGIFAPHFVMYVQDLLVQKFGENMVHRGGIEVITTLDLSLQKMLEKNISSEVAQLKHLNVSNGAGLILDPLTGEILAMAGSRDFFDTEHDGQVNITISQRQPGSSIKPLTYALALGSGLTPSTRIDDSPICFNSRGQAPYCPKNYDGKFHGSVTLRTALASSYNIPAIKLLNSLGVDRLVTLGKNLGITTWDDSSQYGLALTLGGGDVTLLELTNTYATLARGGSYFPTHAILSTTNHTTLPPLPSPQPKQIISPGVAYQLSNILSDNQARSPAFGYRSVLNIPGHQVAVKTGTSNDLRDNWTIGYTSDYVVGIWVGNNDNTSMSSVASGITGASPIWNTTFQSLLTDSPPHTFSPPANLIKVNLSCTDIPHYDYFVPGTEPHINCNPEPEGEIL